jgi:hypothetical protein
MNASDMVLIIGIACVIGGLVGGGIKVAQVEMGQVASLWRQGALIVFGVGLIGLNLSGVILPDPHESTDAVIAEATPSNASTPDAIGSIASPAAAPQEPEPTQLAEQPVQLTLQDRMARLVPELETLEVPGWGRPEVTLQGITLNVTYQTGLEQAVLNEYINDLHTQWGNYICGNPETAAIINAGGTIDRNYVPSDSRYVNATNVTRC